MHNDQRLRILGFGLAGLGAISGYLALVLGVNLSRVYLWGLGFTALMALTSIWVFLRARDQMERRLRREAWGQEVRRDRPLDLYRQNWRDRSQGVEIDERTWLDLDMDAVYAKLDRTLSSSGASWLYTLLHRPLFSEADLREREEVTGIFQNNQAVREEIQAILAKVGFFGEKGFWLLMRVERAMKIPLYLLNSLFALSLLAPLAFLISLETGFMAVGGVFVINLIIHERAQKEILGYFDGARYLGRLIRSAQALVRYNPPGLDAWVRSLKENLAPIQSIPRRTPQGGGMTGDLVEVIAQYVRIYFLTEARNFATIATWVKTYREQILEVDRLVGSVDALISVASYRSGISSVILSSPLIPKG